MKLRFALGIIYRAKSWTICSVADAKWSATRNSSVASCYQPSSCLVDDNFYLGSVSSAVKCRGKGSCQCRHQCDITNGTDGRAPGRVRAPLSSVSRPDSSQNETALVGCALHQHKLHLSEVYGLGRDQAGRIFLKNDGLVFDEGE